MYIQNSLGLRFQCNSFQLCFKRIYFILFHQKVTIVFVQNGSSIIEQNTHYSRLLTVQLYLQQSVQKLLAENFFRITTVHPLM